MTDGFDLQSSMQVLTDLLVAQSLSIAGALAVLVVGLWAVRMIRTWVTRSLTRSALDETLVPFVSNLVYYLLLSFVLIAAITMLGIPTTSFVAVLGALGLAVGLALQGALANFAGGVLILLFKPFKVGDIVKAQGEAGRVEEINILVTSLPR